MKKHRKNVTNEERDDRFRPVKEFQIKPLAVPRVKPADLERERSPEPKKTEPEENGANTQDVRKPSRALTDEERSLLVSVDENPGSSTTGRSAALGLSSYKMNALKKAAIEHGLAEQFTANLGKDCGGNVTLLALTDEGYKAIGKEPVFKRLPNEGPEHWWWKLMICRHYTRKGIPAEIEKSIGGKRADVCIKHNGRLIAIEVETTPKNAMVNIIQDLDAGFDRVLSCSRNRMVEKRIISDFQSLSKYERLKDRVSFRLLSEFGFVKEISRK